MQPTLAPKTIQQLAETLDTAAFRAEAVPMLSLSHEGLTVEDGYAIQRASMDRRLGRGDSRAGMKMGLTSLAKMEQMGVHSPIYGHLTTHMQHSDGATLSHAEYVHPRVEPEIAFILKDDLVGPTTAARAMLAVGSVVAALEVIDSRFQDFKFSLPDVVADNGSSSSFVLGDTVVPADRIDVSNLGMVMEINGVAAHVGSSAAVYEHPARSLAKLANMLHEVGESLRAGDVVLTGGATPAVALSPGDRVRLRVDGLESVSFQMGA